MGFLKRFFSGNEEPERTSGGSVEPERTSGGSVVLRHGEPAAPAPGPGAEGTPYGEAIEIAFNKAFPGRSTQVWHEIVSDRIHLDVYLMEPVPGEPYYVMYTSGMSALPMTLDGLDDSEHCEDLRRAELLAYLPADWPVDRMLSMEATEDVYWPMRLLKGLARLPHMYSTWLGYGHSVPNGEPMAPYAETTDFTGAVLFFPRKGNGPREVPPIKTQDGTVMLYVVAPVYPEEMRYKLKEGVEALEEKLRALPDGQGFIFTTKRRSAL